MVGMPTETKTHFYHLRTTKIISALEKLESDELAQKLLQRKLNQSIPYQFPIFLALKDWDTLRIPIFPSQPNMIILYSTNLI